MDSQENKMYITICIEDQKFKDISELGIQVVKKLMSWVHFFMFLCEFI